LKNILTGLNSEKLDFEHFKPIIASFKKDNDTASKEIRDAFALFDPEGKGRISTEQVKNILTTMEDKLELKDIEPILAQADEHGFLSVDKLVHALLS
jgi:calmodulin